MEIESFGDKLLLDKDRSNLLSKKRQYIRRCVQEKLEEEQYINNVHHMTNIINEINHQMKTAIQQIKKIHEEGKQKFTAFESKLTREIGKEYSDMIHKIGQDVHDITNKESLDKLNKIHKEYISYVESLEGKLPDTLELLIDDIEQISENQRISIKDRFSTFLKLNFDNIYDTVHEQVHKRASKELVDHLIALTESQTIMNVCFNSISISVIQGEIKLRFPNITRDIIIPEYIQKCLNKKYRNEYEDKIITQYISIRLEEISAAINR